MIDISSCRLYQQNCNSISVLSLEQKERNFRRTRVHYIYRSGEPFLRSWKYNHFEWNLSSWRRRTDCWTGADTSEQKGIMLKWRLRQNTNYFWRWRLLNYTGNKIYDKRLRLDSSGWNCKKNNSVPHDIRCYKFTILLWLDWSDTPFSGISQLSLIKLVDLCSWIVTLLLSWYPYE